MSTGQSTEPGEWSRLVQLVQDLVQLVQEQSAAILTLAEVRTFTRSHWEQMIEMITDAKMTDEAKLSRLADLAKSLGAVLLTSYGGDSDAG